MVTNRDVAAQISLRALEAGGVLDSIAMVGLEQCPPEEFEALRLAVGKVMAELWLEVLNPLYRAHPDLKPAELI